MFQGKKILTKQMTEKAMSVKQENSHNPNPFNSRLYSIDDVKAVWSGVKTSQTTKAFYGHNQQRAPDSWLFSNFAKHSPYEYKIPFGKFAGKIVDIPFSERAIMLTKASRVTSRVLSPGVHSVETTPPRTRTATSSRRYPN